jgi:hypothetical protein
VPIWRDLFDATVRFNSEYGRYGYARFAAPKALLNVIILHPDTVLTSLPLWLAAALGIRLCRSWPVLLLAALGVVALKADGFGYVHGYGLVLPGAALLAALYLDRLLVEKRRPYILAAASVVAILMFGLATVEVIEMRRQNAQVAAAIPTTTDLYILGQKEQIYSEAHAQPTRKYFFSTALVVRPEIGSEVRRALLDCPPDVLFVPNPDSNSFNVSWAPDIEVLYAVEKDTAEGKVFTMPIFSCAADPH